MSVLNYIGSKKSLLSFIDFVIKKIIVNDKNTEQIKFLDGFAGSGIVGKYFNQKYNFTTSSNDLEQYSSIIAHALLKVPFTKKLNKLIDEINKLTKPKKDKYNLITKHYSQNGEEERLFWTDENAQKADAVIEFIKNKLNKNKINIDEYNFLLASLITSLDKVANTTSVYGAFLKKFKTSALKPLLIKPIHDDEKIANFDKNEIHNMDVNDVIKTNNYDIVYFDPPYNNRQYSSNYHPLNFIVKYDKTIMPYGKTGLLKDSNKSNYSISKNVENAFNSLITNTKSKHILLSYNNEGLMSSEIIQNILSKKGKTTLYRYKYKKYKSQKTQLNETVYEYLYHCDVEKQGEFQVIDVDL
jgi:adenine-specific DNA-methyltransferase